MRTPIRSIAISHDRLKLGTGPDPLLTGLVAWWDFEEAAGSPRLDSHGANDLAENNGPIATATGIRGLGVDLELGSAQYLTVADNPDVSQGDIDYTIVAWIKSLETLPTVVGAIEQILSKFTAATNAEFQLYVDNNVGFPNEVGWQVHNAGGVIAQVHSSTFGALALGTSYMIRVWHDATNDEIGLQVNLSAPNTAATGGAAPMDNASAFEVGGRNGATQNLDGVLDSIAIWKRLHTDAEVKRLYRNGHGMNYAMLQEPWHERQAGFNLNLVHRSSPGFLDASFDGFLPEERAEGGLYSARFSMFARMTTMKEMFERGLGRWVEVWGKGLEKEFEGLITEMTFNLPPDRFTISLDPVANKAQMRADLDADGVVDRSTQLQNADSQEQYPVSELILGGGQVQGTNVADQTVQQYLNLRAFPRPSLQLGGASGKVRLEVFARGFWWTLARQVYNQTAITGTQAMSAEVRDILTLAAEYVARQERDANTTSVTKEHDADRRPQDLIVDMAKLGDAQSNRWLPAMKGRRVTQAVGRIFVLKQAAPPVVPPTV